MSATTRRRAVRGTSWALLLTAGLVLPVIEAGATYLTLLGASGCAASLVAASQVRHDDVLGWLAAVGAAAPIAGLVVAAHTQGLPGHRAGGWDLAAAGAVTLAVGVLVVAAACALTPAPTSPTQTAAPAGSLRP